MAFSTRHNALPDGHVSHLVDVGYVEHYVLAIAYVTRWFELIACVWITWDDNPWISKSHTSWLLVNLDIFGRKLCWQDVEIAFVTSSCDSWQLSWQDVEIVCALSAGIYWSWYQAYYKYKFCTWEEVEAAVASRNKRRDFLVLSFCKCCVRERIERIFLWYYSLDRNTFLVHIFRRCFQFGPSVLKSFNWIPMFLSCYQFYPRVNSVRNYLRGKRKLRKLYHLKIIKNKFK